MRRRSLCLTKQALYQLSNFLQLPLFSLIHTTWMIENFASVFILSNPAQRTGQNSGVSVPRGPLLGELERSLVRQRCWKLVLVHKKTNHLQAPLAGHLCRLDSSAQSSLSAPALRTPPLLSSSFTPSTSPGRENYAQSCSRMFFSQSGRASLWLSGFEC